MNLTENPNGFMFYFLSLGGTCVHVELQTVFIEQSLISLDCETGQADRVLAVCTIYLACMLLTILRCAVIINTSLSILLAMRES